MDGYSHHGQTRRNLGSLFEEDFDLPSLAPDPEVIEPVFSAEELAAERDAAWHEGHAAGLEHVADRDAAATRQVLHALAGQLDEARGVAAEIAEQSAEAIARLLLESLAAAFPALCARHGEAEVRALVAAVLPALRQEPAITIRANPQNIVALASEIDRLDPEIADRVQVTASDAVSPGDVRVAWRNGSAVRDAASLWGQIAAILIPAGLLRSDVPRKETVYGE